MYAVYAYLINTLGTYTFVCSSLVACYELGSKRFSLP